ncbi:MAG: hypothetical protein RLZZ175_1516 [Bacteroidota bacterium]|jgi:adenosylcobinamide kinase/adenosylcobinamide-phosphate guanylyltransferase
MIYYITGGERSGKSRHAQELAKKLSDNPVYVATARHWDADFEKRIVRHQSERDSTWVNIEEEKNLHLIDLKSKVAVIDCVTLWLTNFYTDSKCNVTESLNEAKNVIDSLDTQNSTYIIISNEIGMGVHAEAEIGRKFVELQGWVNQYIAQKADKAIFMVSGLAMELK